jgi:hypothetical protein
MHGMAVDPVVSPDLLTLVTTSIAHHSHSNSPFGGQETRTVVSNETETTRRETSTWSFLLL